MPGTDFWWLSSSQETKYVYAELGHHRPIRHNEHPCNVSWDTKTCLTNQINHWRERFQNTNVYRSLKIATAPSGGQELIGPFLVDIDNESDDLDDALVVARKTLSFLQSQFDISANNLRIFFTGHKGFNLELHPQTLGMQGSIDDQIGRCGDLLDQITQALRRGKSWPTLNQVSDAETLMDKIYGDVRFRYKLKHPYIRLHRSLNRWIMPDGTAKTRMKIELTVDELNRLPARAIVAMSQKLVS